MKHKHPTVVSQRCKATKKATSIKMGLRNEISGRCELDDLITRHETMEKYGRVLHIAVN